MRPHRPLWQPPPMDIDVLGAAASTLAALGSVGALLVALGLLRIEFERRRDERANDRRQQALAVSAWVDQVMTADDVGDERPGYVVRAVMANLSNNPVSKVTLQVVTSSGAPWLEWKMPVVKPQGWHTHDFLLERDPTPVEVEQLVLEFSDGEGRRWRRHNTLEEVTSDPE